MRKLTPVAALALVAALATSALAARLLTVSECAQYTYDVQRSDAEGSAIVTGTFQDTCAELDLAGKATLEIDGVVHAEVVLGEDDRVTLVAKVEAFQPPI